LKDEDEQLRFKTREVKPRDPLQVRRHVAVHESAHAVVGLARQLELVEIDIDSAPTPHIEGGMRYGGTVFVAPNGDMNELARRRPVDMSIALMAGICAEEVIFKGHIKGGWIGDSRIIKEGHGWIDEASSEAEKRERLDKTVRYMNQAYELVVTHEHAIRKLADVLIVNGRLRGGEVAKLLELGRE
jgi:ATP-dependent Zn protease